MKYNPQIHHRRSIRLKGYDYSQEEFYFVTICAQNCACLFGDIQDGIMYLNDAGQMVEQWYYESQNKFPDIQCGDFICMPNHVHFIVINVAGADLRICPCPDFEADPNIRPDFEDEHIGSSQPSQQVDSSLSKVIQWFKTMTTNAYIRGVKEYRWQPFEKRLWQRNYYEHIIRNEDSLSRIQQYIQNNPRLWNQDKMHPVK